MDENNTKRTLNRVKPTLNPNRPKLTCIKCNNEVSDGSTFCGFCGSSIEPENDHTESKLCPSCKSEINSELTFCTKCGANLKENTENTSICPECYSEIKPGLKFCTKCGNEIPVDEKTDKQSKKLSKGLLKDVDSFLTSASKTIDKSFSGSSKNKRNLNKRKNIKPVRIKGVEYEYPGYLVCDECGGFYKLKSCEGPDDFSNECDCGGELKHLKRLPNLKIR